MKLILIFLVISIYQCAGQGFEHPVSNSLFQGKMLQNFEGLQIKTPPTYKAYVLSAYLELPYAEIKEQFTVYYDPEGQRSRIDYYDGLVKTIQRADTDSLYKMFFRSTEAVLNQLTCIKLDGGVSIQSGIPVLDGFRYIGTADYNGHSADHWKFTETIGSKKNTYTFIVDSKSGKPFRYEMAGYDSLFGSHYDKYYIDYKYFSPTTPDPEVFEPPADTTCAGWDSIKSADGMSAPPSFEHRQVSMNPISEFVNNKTLHHDKMFELFKNKHGKKYSSNAEHSLRKNLFIQNVRFIQSTNRATKSYRVTINHLADRTSNELLALRGFRRVSMTSNAEIFNPHIHNALGAVSIPESIDWRLYGAVTPVKDQAVCGSCWSFGTTGTVEGAHFLKTGHLVRLSQQELVDCSWGEGNNGCDGGEDFQSYEFIKRHGLSSEEVYGPYIAQDGMCKVKNVSAAAHISGYVSIPSGNEDSLREAIAKNGPVSVAIDASHKSLSFYANGIYFEPQCGNDVDSLDHAVLAVGYGTLRSGDNYWLVKNSWSTYWGNDGYVLMSPKDNNCGVATAATFVKM